MSARPGLAELRSTLAVELAKLTADQRDALALRVVQELPYDEVARRLGTSEATARARVPRGPERWPRRWSRPPPWRQEPYEPTNQRIAGTAGRARARDHRGGSSGNGPAPPATPPTSRHPAATLTIRLRASLRRPASSTPRFFDIASQIIVSQPMGPVSAEDRLARRYGLGRLGGSICRGRRSFTGRLSTGGKRCTSSRALAAGAHR
ncbi:MAG: RNA polymerase sigma factor [Solirubrobacteraceae bacterium]